MQSLNVTKQNFKDICRSCMRNPGIVNIFNTKFQENHLNNVIKTSLGVEISSSGEYPEKICGSCLKHILYSLIFIRRLKNNQEYIQELDLIFKDNFEYFVQLSEINEEISTNASLIDEILKCEDEMQFLNRTETVLNIFEKLCGISSMNYRNGPSETIEDEDIDEEEKLIVEKFIKTEQISVSDMDLLDENTPDVEEKIKCEPQDLQSMEECRMESYSSDIHSSTLGPFEIITILGEDSEDSKIKNLEVSDTTKVNKTRRKNSQWECFDCLQVFETLKSLIQHTKEMDHTMPPRFQCEFCLKSFKTAKAFKTHSARHVQGRARTVCDICGASVLQRNFKRHLLGHDAKANVCQYCGKTFVQAGTMALHVRNEHEGRRRVGLCCICGKVCANTSILTTHLNTHSKEELKDVAYGCKECGKYLVSEDSLNMHIQKLHVNPVKTKRPECFKKKINAIRVIKEKKRYIYGPKICPVCSKSISYLGYAAHLRMHAGIKPYECKVCLQTFKQQAHLRTHMNIHLDVKPYECRFCKKMFRHLTSRRTHERAHKGERPFECPVCNKGFYESSPMKKHLKIHSKDQLKKGDVFIKSEDCEKSEISE